jgi:hypothetical protein
VAVSDGTPGFSGEPAPTPAERPRAKKTRRHGDTEHLIDMEGSITRILKLHERQEKENRRNQQMLELICEKLRIPVPPRVA